MKPNRFRFRAWDKSINKMVHNNPESDYAFNTMDVFSGIGMGYDFIPMQSTGLADKNGKEIFEGDIITGRDEENMIVNGYVQQGHTGAYILVGKGYSNGCPLFMVSSPELIGNVHENPELLTVTKKG